MRAWHDVPDLCGYTFNPLFWEGVLWIWFDLARLDTPLQSFLPEFVGWRTVFERILRARALGTSVAGGGGGGERDLAVESTVYH